MSDRVVLRSGDGREVDLGDRESFLAATSEIGGLTGGSSGLGRWSYLWGQVVAGPPSEGRIEADLFDRIAEEAADDFQAEVGRDLSEEANELLTGLAEKGDQPLS